MKSDARKTVGSGSTSARFAVRRCWIIEEYLSGSTALLFALVLLISPAIGLTQALYKYRGPDGEWVYTDRAPDGEGEAEIRELPTGLKKPEVSVIDRLESGQIQLYARNEYYAPVEVVLGLDALENVELPPPDQSLRWVVPPRGEADLLRLKFLDGGGPPYVSYRFTYVYGDPGAVHRPDQPYRAPFAIARKFLVSQAFPVAVTHNTIDSYYAVDIAMPIGTDIYAARGGRVVEVASTNYRSGTDPAQQGASANLVRILHDDGTMAIYAHLNWNTIRVKPGDEVERGEYIADSGNTGFSTGPHLHFVVVHNNGMGIESLPVVFEGPNGTEVTAIAGRELTAY